MTKQLVEEILQLEETAERQLAAAEKEYELTIQRAHEKAHLLVQEAENTLDTEREKALKERAAQLEQEKQQAIKAARTESKALGQTVSKRVPKATEHLRKAFMESVRNVS